MKRNSVLKILVPVLALLMLNQISTGIFRYELSKEVFGVAHKAGGVFLAAVVLLHLVMNWNWVKTNYFKKASKGHQSPNA